MDPGQTNLGEQVTSDYRPGQLVTFKCSFPGYSLSPPYAVSCVVFQNGTVGYNDTVPSCVGKLSV